MTDRIGLIYTSPQTIFSGVMIHYEPNSKRNFICRKSICCDKFGEPTNRMGCAVIKYGTDRLGNVKTPFEYEILPWIFSASKYAKLKLAGSEFSLLDHDIKVACGTGATDEQMQKLDFTTCKESIWMKKEEFKKQVLEEAKPVWSWIKKNLAQNLSIEEIKDLIGGGSAVEADPTTPVDLDSVLKAM
jgi:hypothetical protein